jgi:tetratricopeptide (TPR) repeat protein
MSDSPRLDELRRKFRDNPRRFFAPLASELRRAGRLEEAVALCRAHLPQLPDHLSGAIVYGQALYDLGELTEARAVFEQALRADPENLVALRVLGDIAKRRGDPAAARRWYERVLEADPRNDDIASQLKDLALPISEPRPFRPPSLDAGPVPANAAAAAGAALRERAPTPALSDDDDPFAFPTADLAAPLGPLLEVSAGDWSTAASPRLSEEGTAGGAAAGEADAAFEEGLLAPEAWPDTTDLVARKLTPHALPAFPMPADDETIAAFGRERHDPPAPQRHEETAYADLEAHEALAGGALAEASSVVTAPPGAAAGVVELGAVDEMEAAVDLLFGMPEAPVGPVAPSRPAALWTLPDAAAGAPVVPTPMAGASPPHAEDDDDPPPVAAESAAAFRTETMAELLLAQGFVAQALDVYETLAAERPGDTALASRLATLRPPPGRAPERTVPETVGQALSEAPPPPVGPTARQALAQLLQPVPPVRSAYVTTAPDGAPPVPLGASHPLFGGVGRAMDERMALGWRDAMQGPSSGGGASGPDPVGRLWTASATDDEGLALEDVFAVETPPSVTALPDRPARWGAP